MRFRGSLVSLPSMRYSKYVPSLGAQRHPQTDFGSLMSHHVRNQPVNADRRETKRNGCKGCQKAGYESVGGALSFENLCHCTETLNRLSLVQSPDNIPGRLCEDKWITSHRAKHYYHGTRMLL